MPNDCWNDLTITADKGDLYALMAFEFKDVPEWALKIKRRGVEAVVLKLWSRWQPDFKWLEELLVKYPSCWVKDEWSEEGGDAGIWIGSGMTGQIKRLEWHEMSIEEASHRFREE